MQGKNVPALNFVAGTTIQPSTFVKVSTAADYQCLPVTSTRDQIIGIAYEGSRKPPVTGATGEAANQDDPLAVYGVGQTCYLTLGTTVTHGQVLMTDANGCGIPSTGAGTYYGAVCEQSGVAGNKVKVTVLIGIVQ